MIILATEADEDPWRNPGHGSLLCHDKRGRTQPSSSPLRVTQSNDEVASALGLWCRTTDRPNGMVLAREDMRDSIDVLVVNEADQFSLANAVASAAKSLVLLGDPQQLTPAQAAHPASHGAEVSALQHLIGDHDAIPVEHGIFLETTWRMHPDITGFVSELAYEGRLGSAPGCEKQTIAGIGPLAGSGLRYMPGSHTGRASASPEEADAVHALVADLVTRSWTDADGAQRPMTVDDILVVAPFNAHVAALHAVLAHGVRVGTVDKFQGQQGAVVNDSMASSTDAAAVRGVSFLYDLHRLNVANS